MWGKGRGEGEHDVSFLSTPKTHSTRQNQDQGHLYTTKHTTGHDRKTGGERSITKEIQCHGRNMRARDGRTPWWVDWRTEAAIGGEESRHASRPRKGCVGSVKVDPPEMDQRTITSPAERLTLRRLVVERGGGGSFKLGLGFVVFKVFRKKLEKFFLERDFFLRRRK
ncbi:hypothetical protein vseg_014900 [Gypsophila vaccaria]